MQSWIISAELFIFSCWNWYVALAHNIYTCFPFYLIVISMLFIAFLLPFLKNLLFPSIVCIGIFWISSFLFIFWHKKSLVLQRELDKAFYYVPFCPTAIKRHKRNLNSMSRVTQKKRSNVFNKNLCS